MSYVDQFRTLPKEDAMKVIGDKLSSLALDFLVKEEKWWVHKDTKKPMYPVSKDISDVVAKFKDSKKLLTAAKDKEATPDKDEKK